LTLFVVACSGAIPTDAARDCFEEIQRLCDADDGRLWGRRLDGPVLFVDPATRRVVTNTVDRASKLRPVDGLFTGLLESSVPIANTSVDWAGVRWTMVIWPPPDDQRRHAVLLMHESFHRIQPELGLQRSESNNAHLDSLDGRYWLQLEWRALAKALQ